MTQQTFYNKQANPHLFLNAFKRHKRVFEKKSFYVPSFNFKQYKGVKVLSNVDLKKNNTKNSKVDILHFFSPQKCYTANWQCSFYAFFRHGTNHPSPPPILRFFPLATFVESDAEKKIDSR